MKNALLVAAMLLGSVAFAQGDASAPAAAPAAKKVTRKEASETCKKDLGGAKNLKECVHNKMAGK